MDHNEILKNKHINKKARICSIVCLLFFLFIGIGLVTVVLIFKNQALDLIFSYQAWIKQNFFLTLFIFYCSLIIGGLLVLPTAVFELVNGFIYATLFDGEFYGLFIALAIYLIFTAISGTITYRFAKLLLGRKLKEVLVEKSEKMKMLNFVFRHQGFKAMFLIRLSPLLPSAMFNYLVAGFDITYTEFFFSSFGSFPLTSFYVYIGYSTISIESLERNMNQNSVISIILMIFGIIVLLFSLLYFGRYAKRNFNKMMEENKSLNNPNSLSETDENFLSEETTDTLNAPLNV